MKLDPRCGLILLLAYLIALSTIAPGHNLMLAALCAVPIAILLFSPLPKRELFTQACYVLPFSFTVAAISLLRGNLPQAVFFLLRSYISILSVLIATRYLTTLELLRAMEHLGAPRFLVIVTEFLLRYLDVLRREADSMRLAALCRGAAHSKLIASSSIGMLFVRSLERSTAIHNSMLARGFRGSLPRLSPMQWTMPDSTILLCGLAIISALRLGL